MKALAVITALGLGAPSAQAAGPTTPDAATPPPATPEAPPPAIAPAPGAAVAPAPSPVAPPAQAPDAAQAPATPAPVAPPPDDGLVELNPADDLERPALVDPEQHSSWDRTASSSPPAAPTPRPVARRAVDPRAVDAKVKRWKRRAGGVFGVAGASFLGLVATQIVRQVVLRRCSDNDGSTTVSDEGGPGACVEQATVEGAVIGGYYGTLAMLMTVGGAAGGGVMIGFADASRDVELKGALKSKGAATVAGALTLGLSAGLLITANLAILPRQLNCSADCAADFQLGRFLATDVSAIGMSIGAGLLGYAVGYSQQGKAMMKLRAAPMAGRSVAGLSLAGTF